MSKVAIFALDGNSWSMHGVFDKSLANVEVAHLKTFGIQTRAFPLQDTVDIVDQLDKIEVSLNALP